VYLSLGFIFAREIPRLIILYVWILATSASLFIRISIHTLMGILYSYGKIRKSVILVIWAHGSLDEYDSTEYLYMEYGDMGEIQDQIRMRNIDTVLCLDMSDQDAVWAIVKLCTIYGIPFAYPKILPSVYDISRRDTFIGWLLVVESRSVSISVWERILKRTIDIVLASVALIVLAPVFLIVALAIKLEDLSGPVIYRNRRIWLAGKEFALYKFRYMYWRYCVKDGYGVAKRNDSALQYEEELKKWSDTREWPLYKIENAPRKTRVGRIIEKLSIDELPQLWNVLIGNMSLIWPRPHQPREVALYEEHHHQVLSIKPGISGMAQVYGREKNTFEDEVAYDRYYIEHYSPLLDLMILGKTFFVVIRRIFE
jgi:lipopolysaccharide/colanic/teichoic acid biosynthesis glycosyltransferase